MAFCIYTFVLLSSGMAVAYSFSFPPHPSMPLISPRQSRHSQDQRTPIRIPLMAMKTTRSHGRPFVVLRPISRRQGRRLVLSLPQDNIRILSADAGGTLPLTLSIRDNNEGHKQRLKSGRKAAQASK
ncbi:hypothetical protein JTE90_003602 [Oedothorax gibbosus]|uniref:Uncharacterized protein n=1 Tax=Oedothorax gibbosus TaxID=931172 RepID=A0AAV6VCC9_9ARAC|nr:hypothetical protein JTE90_003602 [Oedothorax gibbosus]